MDKKNPIVEHFDPPTALRRVFAAVGNQPATGVFLLLNAVATANRPLTPQELRFVVDIGFELLNVPQLSPGLEALYLVCEPILKLNPDSRIVFRNSSLIRFLSESKLSHLVYDHALLAMACLRAVERERSSLILEDTKTAPSTGSYPSDNEKDHVFLAYGTRCWRHHYRKAERNNIQVLKAMNSVMRQACDDRLSAIDNDLTRFADPERLDVISLHSWTLDMYLQRQQVSVKICQQICQQNGFKRLDEMLQRTGAHAESEEDYFEVYAKMRVAANKSMLAAHEKYNLVAKRKTPVEHCGQTRSNDRHCKRRKSRC